MWLTIQKMEPFGNESYADVSETTTIYDDDLATFTMLVSAISPRRGLPACWVFFVNRESKAEPSSISDVVAGAGLSTSTMPDIRRSVLTCQRQ